MAGKSNYKLSDKDKKSVTLSIRCTPDMERKVKERAKRNEISTTEWICDCIEIQLKRKSVHEKQKVKQMVEIQEKMNQIISGLTSDQQELKKQLIQLEREAMSLWVN